MKLRGNIRGSACGWIWRKYNPDRCYSKVLQNVIYTQKNFKINKINGIEKHGFGVRLRQIHPHADFFTDSHDRGACVNDIFEYGLKGHANDWCARRMETLLKY